MRPRIAHWISATVRWRRDPVAAATLAVPAPPTGPPLDQEHLVQVGDVLQVCYPERDDTLDDNLTALMLRLTVEPGGPAGPRTR